MLHRKKKKLSYRAQAPQSNITNSTYTSIAQREVESKVHILRNRAIESLQGHDHYIPSSGETEIRKPVRFSIRGSAIEYFAFPGNLSPDMASVDYNPAKKTCELCVSSPNPSAKTNRILSCPPQIDKLMVLFDVLFQDLTWP